GTCVQRFSDIFEQTHRAAFENGSLARLCMKAFDDPHAAERFRQPASHFRIDLAAFAENRTNPSECPLKYAAKHGEKSQRKEGQGRIDFEQQNEGDDRRENASDELDKAGPDQIADTLDIGHDPGYER